MSMIILILLVLVIIEAAAIAAVVLYALARHRELATVCRIIRAANGEAVTR